MITKNIKKTNKKKLTPLGYKKKLTKIKIKKNVNLKKLKLEK